MVPKVFLWHSSMIKTILLDLILSNTFGSLMFSSEMLLIFWIEVTMRTLSLSSLFSLLMSISVFSVSWTSCGLSANPLYSLKVCVQSSILSNKNTTLSASFDAAMSCAVLNEVIVFHEPVVCQINPPFCLS